MIDKKLKICIKHKTTKKKYTKCYFFFFKKITVYKIQNITFLTKRNINNRYAFSDFKREFSHHIHFILVVFVLHEMYVLSIIFVLKPQKCSQK